MIKAYRIFRINKDFTPETLFHGFPYPDGTRSRKVPVDFVLEAERKAVHNPGKKEGPGFDSGWHVCLSLDEADKYLSRFKDQSRLVVAQVWVNDNPRPKPRAASRVFLANEMKLTKGDWLWAIARWRMRENAAVSGKGS